jgi:glucose-1-phosphate thymidylyltransferase
MSEELIGLIPAAGEGNRLALPYPKELYPIVSEGQYKPIAQYTVEVMLAAGVRDIVWVVNGSKHQLIDHFGDGQRYGAQFTYVVQEKAYGMAHAWDRAYHLLGDKTVVMGMPDSIIYPQDAFKQALLMAAPAHQMILPVVEATRPDKMGMVSIGVLGAVQNVIDKPILSGLKYGWVGIVWRSKFTELLHELVSQGVSHHQSVISAAIGRIPTLAFILRDGKYADLGTYDGIGDAILDHDWGEL